MSTLLSRPVLSKPLPPIPQPRVPIGFCVLPCWHCQGATLVREDTPESPECSSCRRANAESVAHQALSDVQDLIRGRGLFAILNADERREQLRQFDLHIEPDRNDADAPTAEERDELESHIELEAIEEYEGDRWDGLE